jgi:hypothetical protein
MISLITIAALVVAAPKNDTEHNVTTQTYRLMRTPFRSPRPTRGGSAGPAG